MKNDIYKVPYNRNSLFVCFAVGLAIVVFNCYKGEQ